MNATTTNATGPSLCDRETIHWQLGFLAAVLGNLFQMENTLSQNDCCGLMNLLYEIADKVYPEGKAEVKS
jgi:hypothetical protein